MTTNKVDEKRVRHLVDAGFLGGTGEVLPVEQTRGLWTDHDGSLTKFHELIGKFCTSTKILEVCGTSATGSSGTAEIKLTDFVCLRKAEAGGHYDRIILPVFFVATARSDAPVHVTAQVSTPANEIVVKVFAWNSSGVAVPGVLVDWHCCARLLKDVNV